MTEILPIKKDGTQSAISDFEELPALLIELKWNKSAESAIDQIRKKKYPEAIKNYGGEILLVAVSYDKEALAGKRKHTCIIEKAFPKLN